MAYAFKDDGTGFIGKDTKGRIYFNGNNSQIYSSNWRGNQQLGMLLDIDDGYLKMQSLHGNYVYTKITGNVENRYFQWTQYRIKPEKTLYIRVDGNFEQVDNNTIIQVGTIVYTSQDISTGFALENISEEDNTSILYWFDVVKTNCFSPNDVGKVYRSTNDSTPVAAYASFDPIGYYYLKESGMRYITLGSNQVTSPLSIGTEKNVINRRFRVDWDGTLHVIDGDFKGDISGSTIRGSAVYASYLEAFRGNIGGWAIENGYLYGGNTILNASTGINTNDIQINQNNTSTIIGNLGYHIGKNGANVLGFKSDSHSIAIEALNTSGSGANNRTIRLSATGTIGLEILNNGINADGDTYIHISNNYLSVTGIDAANQHGIYARFA